MLSAPGFEQPIKRLASTLTRKNLTISVAESCTGGMIGAALSSIPGSSAYFRGGIIAYSNDIKIAVLDVPSDILESGGAVSSDVARAMANGGAALFSSQCSIAVTGIAGPGGGTPQKPVGLVYIGIVAGRQSSVFEEHFSGDRQSVRQQTARAAIQYMLTTLEHKQ